MLDVVACIDAPRLCTPAVQGAACYKGIIQQLHLPLHLSHTSLDAHNATHD